ncbi:MAG: Peptidyl-prolyl cis-trans isomerase (rotamase) [Verrucomicrobia bacterium]|nr:MAG: Peptidyl-prolyl cis-trans isomerase (rotamase) [Verrucomicrobiota bacterium]
MILLLPTLAQAAPPVAPADFTVSMSFPLAAASATKPYHLYLFQWTDRSTDESGFELFAKIKGPAPFSSLGTIAANSTLISTTLSAFSPGTVLQFRLRAFAGSGRSRSFSGYSNLAEITIPGATDFNAPTNLVGIDSTRDNVQLTWEDNSEQEDYFVIEFKESTDASWKFYALPLFNIETFKLSGALEPGKTYNFRVRGLRLQADTRLAIDPSTNLLAHQGVNGSGQVEYTTSKLVYTAPTATVTRTIPSLANPPGRLRGTWVDESTMRLTWFDESDKEQGYEIQFQQQGTSNFLTYDYSAADSTLFEISNLQPQTSATWRVRAAFQRQDQQIVTSAPSAEVTITTPFFAPSDLVAKSSPDSDAITLTWKDNSKVESGYAIYTRPPGNTNPASESLQKTVDAGATTTPLTGLTPGTAYEFLIRAFYNTGTGAILSDPSPSAKASPRNGILSGSPNPLAVGGAVSYQVQTSTSLTRVSWSAEGLPPGLSFNSTSGLISGTPTVSGVFPVTLRATFADGSSNQKIITLRTVLASAPPVALPAGNRTIPPGTQTSIPLVGLFKDPDTESAVRLNTNLGNIDVILFSSATPQTVANFLSYVDNNRYDGVAFHRSVAGFVIQGGAYKPVEAPSKFQTILKFPSPTNEPGLSNLEKTIAMAKLGTDPNSATSEFFFNLANANAANLDIQNGGFTAFARVSNPSWSVVQAMAAKPASPYAYQLDDITTPDVNYIPVAASPDFPWPMNPQPEDSNYPGAPAEIDTTRTVVINSATRITNLLAFSVTQNSNPTGITATISGSNLLVSGATAGAQSQIQITATDLDGTSVNQTFTVRVDNSYLAPVINQGPVNQTALVGSGATFSVQAAGSSPLGYQWRRNGQDLPGKTQANLTINPVTYADQGTYTVVVSNEAASITSSAATLTVTGPPVISTPPSNLTRTYGYSASFSVVATGQGPFTYQWLKGNARIRGATAATYSIPVASMTDAGTYKVVVSNPSGSVTSSVATLTVLPIDTDGDGIFDHEELAAKADLAKTDSDGDGYDDAVELEFGGNPALASKRPTAFFVARTDGPAVLRELLFRRIPSTPSPSTFVHSLDSTTKDIASFWLAAHELTNRQFASILQYALSQNLIQFETPPGGRKRVKYQSETVCYLATHLATEPGNIGISEVDYRDRGGFFVPISAADSPVRGVSWHGAYLATVALNTFANYPGKAVPASWTYADTNGFFLPTDAQWEWAARSGTANLAYPTGAGATAAQANFAAPSGKPRPVSSYAPNAFGLFNLGGNVAEWVFDAPMPLNAYVRGGSWSSPLAALANSARTNQTKTTLDAATGIRLALKQDPATGGANTKRIVTTDGPLTIQASDLGAPRIAGQWYKNDLPMPGKISPILTIPSPKVSDAGTYKFVLTNVPDQLTGAWTSPTVEVAILDAPLTEQSVASGVGAPVTLQIPFGGPGLTFLWQKGTTTLTDGPVYDLVTPTTSPGITRLTVLSPSLDSAGSYTCKVTFQGVEKTIPFKLNVTSAPMLIYDGPATVLNATYRFGIVDPHPLRGPATVTISGLPAGLNYDRTTGLITGKPKQAGVFRLWVSVRNINGNYAFPFNLLVQGLNNQTLGSFSGTVARHPLNNNLGGRLDLSTSSTGTYSGRLTLGTVTHRISGDLNSVISPAAGATQGGNASFQTVIPRTGQNSLQLDVTLNATTNLASGTVREIILPTPTTPPPPAEISGWRNVWSSSVKPTTRLGQHTFRLSVPDAMPAIPRGFGVGSLTVSSTGVASISGRLADGTPFTSSAPLGPNGETLLWNLLYGNGGSILGGLRIRQGTNGSELATHPIDGTATWRKPAIATDRVYPGGLGIAPANSFVLTATGGRYTGPARGKLILDLPDVVPPTADLLRLIFADGGITNPATVLNVPAIEVRPQAALTMPPAGAANPANVTLKVDPASGAFTGTFTLQDGSRPKISYQGQITRDSQPATLTTNLTGNHNDLTFATYEGGPEVNNTTVRYVDPGAPSSPLAVSVSGRALTVTLGTGPGTAQVETAVVSGNVFANGLLNVTVTAAAVTGSPLSIPVSLTTTQTTPDLIAAAIRSALAARAALTEAYTVAGSGTAITLTRKTLASNDTTLNISWGSSVAGVTALANSLNTTPGLSPSDITSTSAQIRQAIQASPAASALVSVAHASGNDGNGTVTTMPVTNLSGGQDGKLRGYGYFLIPQVPTSGQTLLTSPILSGSVLLEEKP